MSVREQEYKQQGVEFVAVNVFENPDKGREWIAGSGLDLLWAFDNGGVAQAFGVSAVPTQILLDREGKVVWASSMSSLFGGADAVFAAIDAAL